MIELETVPFLVELPRFLSKYGSVRFELVRKSEGLNGHPDMDFKIIVGGSDVGKYSIFHLFHEYYSHDGGYHSDGPYPYINCEITLPDLNNGNLVSLGGVYKNGFRRLDAWWEREGIPRKDTPSL